jgi:hypothetical protein
MSAITTRVRGMARWEPRAATIKLLDTVQSILVEYRSYLPMTVRQIFYRLVGAHGYDKTEQAYARLGEHLNRARRASLIEFDAIRDDGSDIQTKIGWDNAADLIETWRNDAETFRLDRQQGQPQRLLFMVEAAGMQPMVAGFTAPFSIPVIPSGGFDSTTAKYRLAVGLGEHGGPTEVLHIGDHDPSGVHLFSSMAEDVDALIRDLDLPGEALFTRLAVTPEQVAELGLPTAPPKPEDKRSFEGTKTTQAEAIPPDVLAQIVTDAITDRLDPAAYVAVLARESAIREGLVVRLDRLLGDDDGDDGT